MNTYHQILISAYKDLEQCCNSSSALSDTQRKGLERALADIQLLGNTQAVQLACGAIDAIAAKRSVDLSGLLEELRADIRKSLSLEAPITRIKHLRFQ